MIVGNVLECKSFVGTMPSKKTRGKVLVFYFSHLLADQQRQVYAHGEMQTLLSNLETNEQ